MSLRSFSPNHRRPRIGTASSTSTIAPASSAAALVPRSVSATRTSLATQSPHALASHSREPIESYTLWQPILRASDQIVLYNPASHAINIVPASLNTVSRFSLPFTNGHNTNGTDICPYCHRPMDDLPSTFPPRDDHSHAYNMPRIEMSPDYFQVLQDVNGGVIVEEVQDDHGPLSSQDSFPRFEDDLDDSRDPSRRWSRVSIDSDSDSDDPTGVADRPESLRSLSGSSFTPEAASGTPLGRSTPVLVRPSPNTTQPDGQLASGEPENGRVNTPKSSNGYYSTFFREETRLGMGANGSVYLCQHVLNGIPLGHFAVKKIAVGDSTSYLMEILREVRLLEKLHHRNIITYHHAWLESARFSSFGLAVPTLHVLMQWAELGSLDDLILQRLGVKSADRDVEPSDAPSGEYLTREDRIRAFRARAGKGGSAHSSGEARRKEARRRAREMKAVHLLSAEEVRGLFGDVVAGLAFLHESSFLHLDLKPGNVLLTLDEGQLIPRAMLSDFGTAQDALQSSRERSGNTGTLEYSAPESLRHDQDGSLRQITSKSDMWSLGMILHKLIYFRLPWKHDEDMGELEKEIMEFKGYRSSNENIRSFTQRRLPAALCHLLSKLLDVDPFQRPGSDQVLKALRARQLDPSPDQREQLPRHEVGPLVRRPTPPSRGNESLAAGFIDESHNSATLIQESSPDLPSMDGRSGSQVRRSSDLVGEISGITPRLLVLEGPAPAVRRVAGLVSSINVSRMLSRAFKCALLISKTILLINLCIPTPPRIAALSFVIGLGLMDMWTRRLRWSFALVVLHLLFIWTMASVDDEMASVDDEMEFESGDEESMAQSQDEEPSSQMEVDFGAPEPMLFVPPPEPDVYGEPSLDRVPTKVLQKILLPLDLRSLMAVRRTSKALAKATRTILALWTSMVYRHRQATSRILLMGPHPVVMPLKDRLHAFQEDILRCAYILRHKWANPAFQARQVTRMLLDSFPRGIEQIHIVPDSMGRFFLTVSSSTVTLWTLEPDGIPHRARIIYQCIESLLEPEMIVQSMVTRPSQSPVAYIAVQITQPFTHRLRTEIYQLHLSYTGRGVPIEYGICAMHETDGALVAFTDYVLAYALGDAAQTILLCCWVTKHATRLLTPVREWEIRWQHSSCRAVAIASDIIVVVRDSAAEVYPRHILDPDRLPPVPPRNLVTGDLEMLPPTYATDIASLPASFVANPRVHIHAPRSTSYVANDMNRVTLSVRVISLVGTARSPVPPTEPSIPYFATIAKMFRLPAPPDSASPSHTAPPSPSHTTPSPIHTHAQLATSHADPQPSPTQPNIQTHASALPNPPPHERYKFVFHLHALQPQHPHLSYGPILTGPNGRSIMLTTNVSGSGGPGQPKQFVLKYKHPSSEELHHYLRGNPQGTVRPPHAPGLHTNGIPPQPNGHVPHPPQHPPQHPPPQPPPHPPPQPPHLLPPPHPPPQHPQHPNPHVQPPQPLHHNQPPHPPPARPDPFGPLHALMRPSPMLDVLRSMSQLWHTRDMAAYEMLTWDEGSGTILVASRRGDVAVLECSKPAPSHLDA